MSGIVRYANVIQCGNKTTSQEKLEERGKTAVSCSVETLVFRFVFEIQRAVHLYFKRLLHQGGLTKSFRRVDRRSHRDRGGDAFCCLKSFQLLDRRNQQIDDSFV